MSPAKVGVFGIGISVTNYEQARDAIIAAARERRSFAVSSLAVHGLMESVRDPELARLVNQIDLVTPDGQPVRWAINILHGAGLKDRVCGPELTAMVCEAAAQQGIGVFCFGSTAQTCERFAAALRDRYPNIRIVGIQSDRFREATLEEDREDVRRINDSGAGIVLVGRGCPRQERWVATHRGRIDGAMMAVGAAFDFLAGNVKRAPVWMQRTGLEWLYRLAVEPRRLWRRYPITNGIFLFLLMREWVRRRVFVAGSASPRAPRLRAMTAGDVPKSGGPADSTPSRPPLIEPRDLGLLALLASMTPASWCLPERSWDAGARGLDVLLERALRRSTRMARHIRAILGSSLPQTSADDCARACLANLNVERLQLLRCYRPGGWRPVIRLEGRDHVDAALAAGCGAILWVAPFIFCYLVSKMAFHALGYRVSHLSRYAHNFSGTRFGALVLNPLRIRVENRYLTERMVIDPNDLIGSERPIDVLADCLKRNGLVSIMATDTGGRSYVVPFFESTMSIASGPPWLAAKTSAALLPVFTIREPGGEFVVRVLPPLDTTARDAGQDDVPLGMTLAYGRLLESHVARHPAQFNWFLSMAAAGRRSARGETRAR